MSRSQPQPLQALLNTDSTWELLVFLWWMGNVPASNTAMPDPFSMGTVGIPGEKNSLVISGQK